MYENTPSMLVQGPCLIVTHSIRLYHLTTHIVKYSANSLSNESFLVEWQSYSTKSSNFYFQKNMLEIMALDDYYRDQKLRQKVRLGLHLAFASAVTFTELHNYIREHRQLRHTLLTFAIMLCWEVKIRYCSTSTSRCPHNYIGHGNVVMW